MSVDAVVARKTLVSTTPASHHHWILGVDPGLAEEWGEGVDRGPEHRADARHAKPLLVLQRLDTDTRVTDTWARDAAHLLPPATRVTDALLHKVFMRTVAQRGCWHNIYIYTYKL